MKSITRCCLVPFTGLAALLTSASLFAAHVPPSNMICGSVQSQTLFAGQTINTGNVNIWVEDEDGNNLADTLHVEFDTSSTDWMLDETHVHVADTVEEIPQTRKGNPKIGKFTYSEIAGDPKYVSYTIDLRTDPFVGHELAAGSDLYVAAHAVLNLLAADGTLTQSETGFGDGIDFPGNSWAMYIKFTVPSCDTPLPPGTFEYRTQTQGGWGTECNGQNPGCYRDDNFAEAFPTGLTVGNPTGTDFTAKFFNSSNVANCLPTGGAPAALSSNLVNSCANTVLLGQVVALTLSTTFDTCAAAGDCATTNGFGTQDGSALLKDLIYTKAGACNGMTVEAILAEANKVLGGVSSTFTPAAINECVSDINENYIDGTVNNGALSPAP